MLKEDGGWGVQNAQKTGASFLTARVYVGGMWPAPTPCPNSLSDHMLQECYAKLSQQDEGLTQLKAR